MFTEFKKVDPRSIKLLEENDSYMNHEQFQRLVSNIKKNGRLTLIPFCWTNKKGDLEVLRGNHRVKAAVAAGLPEIDVLYTKEFLSLDLRIAIQISSWKRLVKEFPIHF